MKALRFHAAKDLRVEDIALPTEPADDEVVIKNRFAGICGTDLHVFHGAMDQRPRHPVSLRAAAVEGLMPEGAGSYHKDFIIVSAICIPL